jgi:hypothetical protein
MPEEGRPPRLGLCGLRHSACGRPPTRNIVPACLPIESSVLWVGGPGPSAVGVAASAPAVRLGPELALQLHQAPHLDAVGTEVGLNLGGRRTDGQVDAEQLGASLQRRRDRRVACWFAQVDAGLVPR